MRSRKDGNLWDPSQFSLECFPENNFNKKKKEVFICHGSSRSKCFLLQLLLLQQFPGTEKYQREGGPFVSNHNAENENSFSSK